MTLFGFFICAIILLMGLIYPCYMFLLLVSRNHCFVNTSALYVYLSYVVTAEYINFQPVIQ